MVIFGTAKSEKTKVGWIAKNQNMNQPLKSELNLEPKIKT
jgi:hypothetical protein